VVAARPTGQKPRLRERRGRPNHPRQRGWPTQTGRGALPLGNRASAFGSISNLENNPESAISCAAWRKSAHAVRARVPSTLIRRAPRAAASATVRIAHRSVRSPVWRKPRRRSQLPARPYRSAARRGSRLPHRRMRSVCGSFVMPGRPHTKPSERPVRAMPVSLSPMACRAAATRATASRTHGADVPGRGSARSTVRRSPRPRPGSRLQPGRGCQTLPFEGRSIVAVRIALCQTNTGEDPEANFLQVTALLEEAAAAGVDLAALPEVWPRQGAAPPMRQAAEPPVPGLIKKTPPTRRG
jgi:hypothetical protein